MVVLVVDMVVLPVDMVVLVVDMVVLAVDMVVLVVDMVVLVVDCSSVPNMTNAWWLDVHTGVSAVSAWTSRDGCCHILYYISRICQTPELVVYQ